MARVLLVDHDFAALEALSRLVRFSRHECARASTGSDGIRIAREFDPDVTALDLRLPDMSGIDLIRDLRAIMPFVACIIVTEHWSRRDMLDGFRAGACDWLDKPVFADDLAAAIKRALAARPHDAVRSPDLIAPEPHAMMRLAEASVLFIGSKRDERTLYFLGRAIGHASGCLRNWCATADLKAKRFRDFTRALRVVYQLQQRPELKEANLLEIIDDRTFRKFRLESGGSDSRLPHTVSEFLDRQQFLEDPDFIAAVRTALHSIECANRSKTRGSLGPTTNSKQANRFGTQHSNPNMTSVEISRRLPEGARTDHSLDTNVSFISISVRKTPLTTRT